MKMATASDLVAASDLRCGVEQDTTNVAASNPRCSVEEDAKVAASDPRCSVEEDTKVAASDPRCGVEEDTTKIGASGCEINGVLPGAEKADKAGGDDPEMRQSSEVEEDTAEDGDIEGSSTCLEADEAFLELQEASLVAASHPRRSCSGVEEDITRATAVLRSAGGQHCEKTTPGREEVGEEAMEQRHLRLERRADVMSPSVNGKAGNRIRAWTLAVCISIWACVHQKNGKIPTGAWGVRRRHSLILTWQAMRWAADHSLMMEWQCPTNTDAEALLFPPWPPDRKTEGTGLATHLEQAEIRGRSRGANECGDGWDRRYDTGRNIASWDHAGDGRQQNHRWNLKHAAVGSTDLEGNELLLLCD